MTNTVTLGIWDRAPFQGAIDRSVDALNRYLSDSEFDTRYEVVKIPFKSIKKLKTIPDVFIFDGGEDVNPERYGERNRFSYFSNKRDDIEFGFARFMNDRNVRLSGVCRGHQLLNVFFGGSLHQDIRKAQLFTAGLKHGGGHKVKLAGGYKKVALREFVGSHSFTVSSLHHQAVSNLASKFITSLVWEVRGRSGGYNDPRESGHIIEGIERADGRIRGLQCHPEFRGYPKDGLMFAYLMHVDNFVESLRDAPSAKDLETNFKHLASARSITKNKDQGPFKVSRPGLGRVEINRDAELTYSIGDDLEEPER